MFKLQPLIVFVCLLSFISCDQISPTKIIRFGHGLSTSHPVHKAMVIFGEKLEEISEGRFKVLIYPSQQLGTERQLIELVDRKSVV